MRQVALPPEHGGWGLLLEPLVLGLAVAPGGAGALVALGAIGAFLARHPLKIIIFDRRRGGRYARTTLAGRVVAAYACLAALGFAFGLRAAPPVVWGVLAGAVVLSVIQFRSDLRHEQRQLVPELAGAAALAAMAPTIAMLGGLAPEVALGMWLLLMARAVPAILYVRARLRRARGIAAPLGPPLLAHAAAVVMAATLGWARVAPWTGLAAMLILGVRAVLGLQGGLPPVATAVIGKQELAYGVLTVALLLAGYLA